MPIAPQAFCFDAHYLLFVGLQTVVYLYNSYSRFI